MDEIDILLEEIISGRLSPTPRKNPAAVNIVADRIKRIVESVTRTPAAIKDNGYSKTVICQALDGEKLNRMAINRIIRSIQSENDNTPVSIVFRGDETGMIISVRPSRVHRFRIKKMG